MDAAAIDLEPASFDAVVARMTIMFVGDLTALLAGVRRVLRADARFAATTWAEPARNPFQGLLMDAVAERGRMPPATPDMVRAFSMGDGEELRGVLERAGFEGVVVERVAGERTYGSLDEAMGVHDEGPARQLTAAMSPDERAEVMADLSRAYTRYRRADGVLAFPMETIVVAGA
jgi:hypothetical protein